MKTPVPLRRLYALCRKETWQILRDPSSNLIAFVLPVVMLFIFGYGINLDSTAVNIGWYSKTPAPKPDISRTIFTARPISSFMRRRRRRRPGRR